jgi:hypothetical protein
MTNKLTQLDEWRAARAAREIEDARRKAAERKEREAMIAEYPYLIPMASTDDCKTSKEICDIYKANDRNMTKNIKTMLKRAFPAIKFSVRRENYSMGFHYVIEYKASSEDWKERDAMRDKVEQTISPFLRESEFGMDDSFTRHDTPFTRTFGGMPYHAHIYDN